jgi:hypothetical protein
MIIAIDVILISFYKVNRLYKIMDLQMLSSTESGSTIKKYILVQMQSHTLSFIRSIRKVSSVY